MQLYNSTDIKCVMDMYMAMIYRLSYVRTGNHHDAEDICQEVFLTLVRKNPIFETEENRRAWLIRITINRSASLWRTAWRKHVVLGDDGCHHPSERQEDKALADALSVLSGDERTLIQLFYYEGFRTEEIAAMLGRKAATVRTQISRARKKLKEQLIQEG